jgi:hypothetical protein
LPNTARWAIRGKDIAVRRSTLSVLVSRWWCWSRVVAVESKPKSAPTQETEIIEETTAPRETTEVTTGFVFSVSRSPMDEESPEDVLA